MRNFRKREAKVSCYSPFFNVEEVLEKSTVSKCPWFNGMGILKGFRGSIYAYLAKKQEGTLKGAPVEKATITAKACPAISSILSESLIIKSPCDVVFSYDSNEQVVMDTPSPHLNVNIEIHPKEQVDSEVPLNSFKDKIIIKYLLPLYVSVQPGMPYLILPPQYHKSPEGVVLEGVVSSRGYKQLNVIYVMDAPEEGEVITVNIRKGDVLAYLWADARLRIVETLTPPKDGKITKFLGNKYA